LPPLAVATGWPFLLGKRTRGKAKTQQSELQSPSSDFSREKAAHRNSFFHPVNFAWDIRATLALFRAKEINFTSEIKPSLALFRRSHRVGFHFSRFALFLLFESNQSFARDRFYFGQRQR
jgi:hypothetical protein